MIDLVLEQRVRAAARASVDAVTVPPPPVSLRRLGSGASRRRRNGWLWAGAAAAGVALAVATDGGRAAIAYAVEHTVKVFSVDPNSGKRVAPSTISLQEAMSTPAFHVVAPRGLPSGALLLSIQRIGDPETGRASVVFHYALRAGTLDILEHGLPPAAGSVHQMVRSSSSTIPEPGGANATVAAPTVAFRAGRTEVTLSAARGALAEAEVGAIRAAMTAVSTEPRTVTR